MATVDPLSLVTMAPATTPSEEEDLSFDNYCIVCDRLIVHPKTPEPETVKPKKKAAGGTIRVKNPDGTTTTRTANGAKTTRPGLKRNPNSANRLAAVAAGNNVTAKLQPLTRSRTADPTPTHLTTSSNTTTPTQSQTGCCPSSPPFVSAIYCSRECAQADAGRSNEAYKEISRTLSYDWSAPLLEGIVTTGLPVTDKHNPYAPPSPLFISGSDTDSSHAGEGPAGSAPEYFRMSRDRPDAAWNDVQRQRRNSMHRPLSLARQMSHTSVNQSSDSLASLWNTESELARSTSNGGHLRTARALSSSSEKSERSAPISARPIARSNLSQTSLASSPRNGQPIPPEFGSAPSHTLSLLHSYAAAFPVRDPSSASYTHKGFVFPGSGSVTPDSRRGSTTLARPVSGTIRQSRPRTTETSWDAFGRHEVEAQNARSAARGASRDEACTPKQSLEVENGQWKIKYVNADAQAQSRSARRNFSKSPSASVHSHESDCARGVPIRPRLATSVTSTGHSRTPQASRMPPPSSIPVRATSAIPRMATSPLPDLAALRIGSSGCAPYLNPENASVPKSGFNWEDHERKGGKMYELPQGIKIDRSKAGLFYFN